jgi:hypothetical protein
MRASFLSVFTLLLLSVIAPACRQKADTAPPIVTPSITLERSDASVGSPVEMTYRFVVAPNAKVGDDYWVFVHFLDTDRELMWTDDHQPPVPTRDWKPGQTIEYKRTMFIPKFPYVGEVRVEVGLYSPKTGDRVPMTGDNRGQRSYRVAKLNLKMQTDNLFVVFKEGWQEAETSGEGVGLEWQWSKKAGVLAFRNPMKDALFYLQLDQPAKEIGVQHVDVRLGDTIIDSFDLQPGQRELRKIPIAKDKFGTGDTGEITLDVAKTFVPATIPEMKNTDARELGVRVFRAYLQPT